VLHCVAVCRSLLQFVAVCCSVLWFVAVCCNVLRCVAVCGSVLQCMAVCGSVWQCAAVCCSVLQCVEVCCRVCYFAAISATCHCLRESARAIDCGCASYCNAPQRTAAPCNTLQCLFKRSRERRASYASKVCCRLMQCVAACCSDCSVLQQTR